LYQVLLHLRQISEIKYRNQYNNSMYDKALRQRKEDTNMIVSIIQKRTKLHMKGFMILRQCNHANYFKSLY
jgi:hypothetical protein